MEVDEDATAERPTVLIVDDQSTNLERLAKLLNDAYRVLIAKSGEKALEIIARQRLPDVILLDIVMPGMSGYEVLERLQQEPHTQGIPVIFITAKREEAEEAHGLDLGAVDYITKPFSGAVVRARVWTHTQLKIRSDELAAKNRCLQEQRRKIEQDLAVASRIQQTLLPEAQPDDSDYNLAWSYQPCDELGGDALSVIPLSDGRIALYMLDVSGHGVAAALVSFVAAQSLRQRVTERGEVSPAAILEALDAEFPLERFEKFFTILFLIYDPVASEIRYCNAGHPPGLLVRQQGGCETLATGGLPIGVGGWGSYEEGVVAVGRGDLLLIYTDGLVEFEDSMGTPFSEERLEAALEQWRGGTAEGVVRGIERMMAAHTEEVPEDDVTFACLSVRGRR
ncbi:serine phosphatase RsbU [Halorhodospira halochloris]|uniref:Serine phosphatase RsbU n=1 Tax=Halorhodospira halochloris TaxID=1052 RepID=A0A110B4U5_HALHR|nr:SpoIIE family protein phosphatase [Halorhodospira halochloris]MBK1651030.1 hypothetical protein [Halorhodospira halochloris]BAU56457.1 serine phosphatase RsbU [Halorhodospira halochloris]